MPDPHTFGSRTFIPSGSDEANQDYILNISMNTRDLMAPAVISAPLHASAFPPPKSAAGLSIEELRKIVLELIG